MPCSAAKITRSHFSASRGSSRCCAGQRRVLLREVGVEDRRRGGAPRRARRRSPRARTPQRRPGRARARWLSVAVQHLAGRVRGDLLAELLRDRLADRLRRASRPTGRTRRPCRRRRRRRATGCAVDGGRRLLDELLGEDPHRVVVAVRLVHLQRGELGVVLEVGALVAELPARSRRPSPSRRPRSRLRCSSVAIRR